MPETINVILQLLFWLAGAGAGVVASWLFVLLRSRWPEATIPTSAFRQLLHSLLWRPDRAAWSAPLLATLLGGLSGLVALALQAAVRGGDVWVATDHGLALLLSGLVAFVTNQQAHKANTKQEPAP